MNLLPSLDRQVAHRVRRRGSISQNSWKTKSKTPKPRQPYLVTSLSVPNSSGYFAPGDTNVLLGHWAAHKPRWGALAIHRASIGSKGGRTSRAILQYRRPWPQTVCLRYCPDETSSVHTLKEARWFSPNVVVSATSAASRPRAISTRPIRGLLWRGSKTYHCPPR